MKNLVTTWAVSFLVLVGAGVAQPPLFDSSVPGIKVQLGWDAEIFKMDPELGSEAVEMALESDGNLLASSNFRIFPGFDSPVFRISPAGEVVGTSRDIRDPDGICVDPMGRIMVAGGRKITWVKSFDPTDPNSIEDFATVGFTNLNWIKSDSAGNLYVSENDGRILRVDVDPVTGLATGMPTEVYYADSSNWRAWLPFGIGPDDNLYFSDWNGGLERVGTHSTAANPQISTIPVGSANERAGGAAFRNGMIYVTVGSRIVTVDMNNPMTPETFATGITGPITFDAKGNLLLTNHSAKRIIRIFKTAEFGVGCPTSEGVNPRLTCPPGSVPQIGQTFSPELSFLPMNPQPLVVGFIGFDNKKWGQVDLPLTPAAFVLPGCTQYISPSPIFFFPQANAGTATWDIPIPNNPNFTGLKFYLQAGVLEFLLGHVSLSNALAGVVQ